MSYQIEYSFYAGDSLRSTDYIEVLELEWEDLNIAKQNLKRIKEHWDYYVYSRYNEDKAKEIEEREPDWLVKHGKYPNTSSMKLFTDNGHPFQFSCPWCGWACGLYGAKIITKPDLELEFTT